jgi:hypothetical protein
VEPPDANKTPTKRNVLTAIAAVYDPLQFLSPFLVRAKILMQEIWRAGLDWDDNLPSDLATKWKNWSTELSQLSHVAIPRCLRLANPNKMELHLFSDASKDAYASVAYLMCQYEDDSPISRLVASKSRVAPTKAMTIPRLELMGAILSSRLGQSLLKVLSVDRVIFWTDSENVWYWVRNHSRQFKPFVANHIAEIQRMTSPEQWRHVPGIQNPADLATRGQSAMELAKSTFWLEGPSFLKDVEISEPSAPSGREETKVEDVEKTVVQTYIVQERVNLGVDPNHFSTFHRLCRVTGWAQRFVTNSRLPRELRKRDGTLCSTEILNVEKWWIKQAQGEAFPKGELEGCLLRLSPKNGDDGLLGMDGRLRLADEPSYNSRHPILLPKEQW